MKITKSVVDKLLPPKDHDRLKGFAVRITTSGVKSFVVEKLINGKVKRITLGRYGELTVEQARKDLKPKTLYDYNNLIRVAFHEWVNKPLLSITKNKIVKYHELAAWYIAVENLGNETLRDYLFFILFTGLLRQEAAKLKWDQVDLKSKTFKIIDTKNRGSYTLPLPDYLFELLINRRQNSMSDYVFPGTGESGYIIEPKKQITKVIEATGIYFTIHDLRRTFITIAESLDIAAYALKRLLNHKMNGDVTAGYIMLDVERLRKPMQIITDHLLLQMGLRNSSVVHFIKEDLYEKAN